MTKHEARDDNDHAPHIALRRVHQTSDALLMQINSLYLASFPCDQRRESIFALGHDPRFVVDAILQGGHYVGFITRWQFDEFEFLEHLATLPAIRGQGVAGVVLGHIMHASQLCIAETEMEDHGAISARRIAYYQRLGFLVNQFPYQQPSYGAGKPSVPMRLISFPRSLQPAECAAITREIHRVVYA